MAQLERFGVPLIDAGARTLQSLLAIPEAVQARGRAGVGDALIAPGQVQDRGEMARTEKATVAQARAIHQQIDDMDDPGNVEGWTNIGKYIQMFRTTHFQNPAINPERVAALADELKQHVEKRVDDLEANLTRQGGVRGAGGLNPWRSA